MKTVFWGAAVMVVLISCHGPKEIAGNNDLTKEDRRNGWKLLFDGQTTKGWHRYGGAAIDSVWKVKDGMLCLDTMVKKQYNIKGDWDIVTDEKFENFHLKLEWKVSEAGNSGIIFYVHEDTSRYKSPWESGPEMQVLDNNGHPDAKFQKHRAGDLYDLVSVSKETVKPYNEWNLAEIRCQDGHLDLYLNGTNVISTTMWDDNWKNMIANSKFRNMPGFGMHKKGRISLQDHGNAVCYRNISIRRL